MSSTTRARIDNLLTEMVSTALVARLATDLHAPGLATRAARRTVEVAEHVVIALSPAVARTPVQLERERLGGRDPEVLADLLERRYPPPPVADEDDLDERGGAS